MKMRRGESLTARGEVRTLSSAMDVAKIGGDGQVLVDTKPSVGKELLETIKNLGGEIRYPRKGRAIRALCRSIHWKNWRRMSSVVWLARPPSRLLTARRPTPADRLNGTSAPLGMNGARPSFNQRDERSHATYRGAHESRGLANAQDPALPSHGGTTDSFASATAGCGTPVAVTNAGSVTSRGDVATTRGRPQFLRRQRAGVKIGVLSDGVNWRNR